MLYSGTDPSRISPSILQYTKIIWDNPFAEFPLKCCRVCTVIPACQLRNSRHEVGGSATDTLSLSSSRYVCPSLSLSLPLFLSLSLSLSFSASLYFSFARSLSLSLSSLSLSLSHNSPAPTPSRACIYYPACMDFQLHAASERRGNNSKGFSREQMQEQCDDGNLDNADGCSLLSPLRP